MSDDVPPWRKMQMLLAEAGYPVEVNEDLSVSIPIPPPPSYRGLMVAYEKAAELVIGEPISAFLAGQDAQGEATVLPDEWGAAID